MPESLPLSPLDLVSAKLHRDERSMDFALVVRFAGSGPGKAALRAGAQSACHTFPSSGSKVVGRCWEWIEDDSALTECVVASSTAGREAMEHFVDAPFDPHEGRPVRQMLVVEADSGDVRLVTRLHHCAFDGISAGLWLMVQLSVAAGTMPAVDEVQPWTPPVLRQHDAPVRRSAYAFGGPSGRVWSDTRRSSPQRRWQTLSLEAAPIRAAANATPEVTYNDVLASSWLEALIRWNEGHGARNDNLGLWLPTNIRQQPFAGFGNGSSRIRVYGRWSLDASPQQRCTSFREQVAWSKAHGEWHVPADSPLLRQPDWLLVPVLRAVLGRPWVDMGSSVFSHVEQVGTASALLPMVRDTQWVSMLHHRFPVGIVGATLGTETSLSLTWDPAMISDEHAEALLESYRQVVNETVTGLLS